MKDHVGFTRAVLMTLATIFLSVGFFPRMAHAAPSAENSSDSYTVVIPGDSLSRIAERLCGSSRQWKTIARANGINTSPFWVYLTKTYIIPCGKTPQRYFSTLQPTAFTNVTSAVLPLVGRNHTWLSWSAQHWFPILVTLGGITIAILVFKIRRVEKDNHHALLSVVPAKDFPESLLGDPPTAASRFWDRLGRT